MTNDQVIVTSGGYHEEQCPHTNRHLKARTTLDISKKSLPSAAEESRKKADGPKLFVLSTVSNHHHYLQETTTILVFSCLSRRKLDFGRGERRVSMDQRRRGLWRVLEERTKASVESSAKEATKKLTFVMVAGGRAYIFLSELGRSMRCWETIFSGIDCNYIR
jgi:hypothetical protein